MKRHKKPTKPEHAFATYTAQLLISESRHPTPGILGNILLRITAAWAEYVAYCNRGVDHPERPTQQIVDDILADPEFRRIIEALGINNNSTNTNL